ncbi:MAG: hypothetical protein A3H59_00855 [Candidatus Jacksonbacteria bacterium RIFCSPLOWO2_02_FULL_43_9]|nr:MAG: hypothetical protein UV70_C0007G0027 [Parcubacteria group bacterium GW2011_GWA2_43_13]OGY71050.1 MAG: hypothetical protein A2986_01080 [Candidatus Jacksonbacteria bacterium RIFCSPLOWO2_01_FULL_44_13]OGY73840.1 MAG: hypothetical protein A3H59_00855 [Candidatus Jacksonbacteria bacterium RIFCSPLOWO2_02_FULL_43_9]HAZ16879.1 hypothetical protein [Candidatus Jacksonbacteria bacterium]
MCIRIFFALFLFIQIATFPLIGHASQEQDQTQSSQQEGEVLPSMIRAVEANAGDDQSALVNTESFFSAEKSVISQGREEGVSYVWSFGDGATGMGRDVSHVYKEPGEYRATVIIEDSGINSKDSDDIIVRVMEDAIFLMYTEDVPQESIAEAVTAGQRNNFLVHLLGVKKDAQDFVLENNLSNELLERTAEIRKSKLIVLWTEGSIGINALARFGQTIKNPGDFSKKGIVVVEESSSNILARLAQPIFDIFTPQYLLIASPRLVSQIIQDTTTDTVIANVQQSGEQFRILGIHSRRDVSTLTPYNFFSVFINWLINRGVSVNTVFLILMLPIIATIVAFSRQIIGIKTFGIYIPTILTITLATTGLKEGLIILAMILCIGTIARMVLKKLRLLYLPRVALVLTLVSFAMLALLSASTYYRTLNLIGVSIFPILILIVLVEEFVKVQMEEGTKTATFITTETLAIAIVGYYVVQTSFVRNFVLSYPEIVLITVLINYILGRWHGLRLLEYYRFRNVLAVISEQKESKKKVPQDHENEQG